MRSLLYRCMPRGDQLKDARTLCALRLFPTPRNLEALSRYTYWTLREVSRLKLTAAPPPACHPEISKNPVFEVFWRPTLENIVSLLVGRCQFQAPVAEVLVPVAKP